MYSAMNSKYCCPHHGCIHVTGWLADFGSKELVVFKGLYVWGYNLNELAWKCSIILINATEQSSK